MIWCLKLLDTSLVPKWPLYFIHSQGRKTRLDLFNGNRVFDLFFQTTLDNPWRRLFRHGFSLSLLLLIFLGVLWRKSFNNLFLGLLNLNNFNFFYYLFDFLLYFLVFLYRLFNSSLRSYLLTRSLCFSWGCFCSWCFSSWFFCSRWCFCSLFRSSSSSRTSFSF